MPYRTCKRCSVTRVNILCKIYEQSFHEKDKKAERHLSQLVKLAADRGYEEGLELINGIKEEAQVRSICWNVSSVLTDDDLKRLGYPTNRRR